MNKINILVIGFSNVGKTTFINELINSNDLSTKLNINIQNTKIKEKENYIKYSNSNVNFYEINYNVNMKNILNKIIC